jgi:hypothetical protein
MFRDLSRTPNHRVGDVRYVAFVGDYNGIEFDSRMSLRDHITASRPTERRSAGLPRAASGFDVDHRAVVPVFPNRLIEVLLEQFAQWQCRLTRAVGENASRSTSLAVNLPGGYRRARRNGAPPDRGSGRRDDDRCILVIAMASDFAQDPGRNTFAALQALNLAETFCSASTCSPGSERFDLGQRKR